MLGQTHALVAGSTMFECEHAQSQRAWIGVFQTQDCEGTRFIEAVVIATVYHHKGMDGKRGMPSDPVAGDGRTDGRNHDQKLRSVGEKEALFFLPLYRIPLSFLFNERPSSFSPC